MQPPDYPPWRFDEYPQPYPVGFVFPFHGGTVGIQRGGQAGFNCLFPRFLISEILVYVVNRSLANVQ